MISRYYFISVIGYHDDGNGSFSYYDNVGKVTGLFPSDPSDVNNMMFDHAKKKLKDKGCSSFRVAAFNRV